MRKPKIPRKPKRHVIGVIPKDEREFLQTVHMELVHVRAAMFTVAVALDGKGVHGEMAILLRGTIARLHPIMETLDEM